MIKIIAVCALCLILVGCGGSDNESADSSVLTGIFVDSRVEGISYATATQSGVTNVAGEFRFVADEQITFSIGDTVLPSGAAADVVSPLSLATASGDPESTTINIARLLQSLDSDGEPDNGISVPGTAAAASSESIDFDVSVEEFENNPDVLNLVANSGSVTTTLIPASDAIAHLTETLEGLSSNTVESSSGDIVLDLRNTNWTSVSPGCDGMDDIVNFNYSDTEWGGDLNTSINFDGSCGREARDFGPVAFSFLANSTAALFVCGDGQCTFDEINRTLDLAAGDPRNDCVDANNLSVPAMRSISHEPGSDSFFVNRCGDGVIAEYIRQ